MNTSRKVRLSNLIAEAGVTIMQNKRKGISERRQGQGGSGGCGGGGGGGDGRG